MRYLLCGLMALALSGCASVNYAQKHADAGHYNYNPNDSMALNVARATGLTECDEDGCAPLRDVPREKLPASMQGKTNLELAGSVMDALTIGQGVGQIAGVASVVTGVGDLAGGLLTLGSLFTGPVEMDNPATKFWVNMWMPKTKAATPEQAQSKMISMLRSSLPVEFSGYGAEYKSSVPDDYFDMVVTGAQACNGPDYYCEITISYSEPAEVNVAPEWVGSQSAYVWQNWKIGQSSNGAFHQINIDFRLESDNENADVPADFDPRAYLAELSKNLPSWAYIYLPPTERHDYPAMLNQGKLLLFVEPKQAI